MSGSLVVVLTAVSILSYTTQYNYPSLFHTPEYDRTRTLGGVAAEEVLTVAEVAQRLRVGQESVRRWLREGKLRGVRTGTVRGGWRIPEPEYERFKREGPAR
jgi:excisionase family DNA binding protein